MYKKLICALALTFGSSLSLAGIIINSQSIAIHSLGLAKLEVNKELKPTSLLKQLFSKAHKKVGKTGYKVVDSTTTQEIVFSFLCKGFDRTAC